MCALFLAATFVSGLRVGVARHAQRAGTISMQLHTLKAKGMDGTEVSLDTLAGKNVVALNVASR